MPLTYTQVGLPLGLVAPRTSSTSVLIVAFRLISQSSFLYTYTLLGQLTLVILFI